MPAASLTPSMTVEKEKAGLLPVKATGPVAETQAPGPVKAAALTASLKKTEKVCLLYYENAFHFLT